MGGYPQQFFMKDLKREWVDDLLKKIAFINSHPSTIDSFLLPEQKNDKDAIDRAKKAVERAFFRDNELKDYLISMIEKVNELKQNPATKEEKQLWYEIMKELKTDFDFNHDSRNKDMGWAGELIIGYMFEDVIK